MGRRVTAVTRKCQEQADIEPRMPDFRRSNTGNPVIAFVRRISIIVLVSQALTTRRIALTAWKNDAVFRT